MKRKKRAAKPPASMKPEDVTAVLDRLGQYQGKFTSVTIEAAGMKVTASFEAPKSKARTEAPRAKNALDSLKETPPFFAFGEAS